MSLLRLDGGAAVGAELRRYSVEVRGLAAKVRAGAARRLAGRFRARMDLQFASGTDPYGRPWKPPADGHSPPMIRSGRLRRSYRVRVLPDGRGLALSFESSRDYSWWLQKGRPGMTARKQVPDGRLPDEWAGDPVQSYQEALDDWFSRLKGA